MELITPAVPEIVLTVPLKVGMTFRWDLGDGWTRERQIRTGDMTLCLSPQLNLSLEVAETQIGRKLFYPKSPANNGSTGH